MVKNINFLFDIDGTLTPSRSIIDSDFQKFFLKWMVDKNIYFVTGSDKQKTIEQIGEQIWKNAKKCYQSCGNAVYKNGVLIKKLDFLIDNNLNLFLKNLLNKSKWKKKYNRHIDQRIGLINFSTIGRDCPREERNNYYTWDTKTQERHIMCEEIQKEFPLLEASIGGQISIDIYPKGKNKAQVLDEINGPVVFFGDKCNKGGNDYPIVERLELEGEKRKHTVYNVQNFNETWNILKTL